MLPSDVLRHAEFRQRIAAAAESAGQERWSQLHRLDAVAWLKAIPELAVILAAGQLAAAAEAEQYVTEAIGVGEGQGNPEALAGVASDGRSLESLLFSPMVAAVVARRQGATLARARAAGSISLRMILHTQVADAGRMADQVAISARRGAGYVRVSIPPSCSRCAMLAGRFYRYNAGFRRHPRCNCVHVPVRGESAARSEGLVADPREYFRSLSRAEQDRVFTKDGAKAIRLGADIGQVVNARRGATGLATAARLTPDEARILRGGRDRGRLQTTRVFGQDAFVTTEGTTRRGLAGQRLIAEGSQVPRLMPESIFEFATSQEDAIRLLRRFGYLI
jgi:hypothetical protein